MEHGEMEALLQTTDAQKWAEVFSREFMVIPRHGWPMRAQPEEWAFSLMIGWFANAIGAGETLAASVFKEQLANAGQAHLDHPDDEPYTESTPVRIDNLAQRVLALELAVAGHNHASLAEAHRAPRP